MTAAATPDGVALAADPALAASADILDLSPMEAAVRRLTASRTRLRTALIPAPLPTRPAAEGGGALWGKLQALWDEWRGKWHDSPVIDVLLSSVQSWWRNNPVSEVASVLAAEGDALLSPAVRRWPWTAVLAAAGAGLVIATVRPWRWTLVAAQFAPLRRQAVNWIVKEALTTPLHTMFAGLMAWLAVRRDPPSTDARATP